MCSERPVDLLVPDGESCRGVQEAGVSALAQRVPREVEPTDTERRGRGRPGFAVTVASVGARLHAQRDQLGEVGHGGDVSGLGDADEPVRVEVVAEERCRVAIRRYEEARAAVVHEVPLVDRLQTERLPGRAEGGDHGLALANEIPGASLLALKDTGHEYFPRATWDVVVPLLLRSHVGA